MNNRYLDEDDGGCFSATHNHRRPPKVSSTPHSNTVGTFATPFTAVQKCTAPLSWKTFFYSWRDNFVIYSCLLLKFWKLWRCRKMIWRCRKKQSKNLLLQRVGLGLGHRRLFFFFFFSSTPFTRTKFEMKRDTLLFSFLYFLTNWLRNLSKFYFSFFQIPPMLKTLKVLSEEESFTSSSLLKMKYKRNFLKNYFFKTKHYVKQILGWVLYIKNSVDKRHFTNILFNLYDLLEKAGNYFSVKKKTISNWSSN